MTQKILLLILSVMISQASAQVGINTITPDPSAALDVTATDKGLLIPRVALASAIASPAAGLMVHQTTAPAGFYYYNGTAWTMIGGGSPSELEKITEAGKTGHRILGRNPLNYGDIGIDAIDLSLSPGQSPTKGATGDYSTSLGYNTTASGFNSTAMGSTTVASGQSSTAMGIGTTASGQNSTAMGENTTASGPRSTSMGIGTTASGGSSNATGTESTASGFASTAMGQLTIASGARSAAMGLESIASGDGSTAMGDSTTAKSYAETTVGLFNTDYTPANATAFNAADRAFGVGIGANNSNRKDGLIVYKDGTLAFNKLTVTPTTTTDRFYVLNNKLNYNGGEVGASELQKITEGANTGWRILGRNPANYGDIGSAAIDLSFNNTGSTTSGATGEYSTAIGAFTTASGYASTSMGNGSTASGGSSTAIGNGSTASGGSSTAMGNGSIASGINSTAMGVNTNASSDSSTAMGSGTSASGTNSTTMGNSTTASGSVSTALGAFSTASGTYSTAMGAFSTASGFASTAMGNNTIASGTSSTAMGANSTASGDYSTAMGFSTTASGTYSTAMGYLTKSKSFAETTVGLNNTDYTPASTFEHNAADRAFGVGIGTNASNRKDGLIVYKDGTLAFNKLTAAPATSTDRFYVLNNKLNYNGAEVGGSELQKLTEGGQTGWRLLGRDPAYHGNIGSGAIDLTFSDDFSETLGATGVNSTAMGINTTASGAYSIAMGSSTTASGATTTAMGDGTTASGDFSTAMGQQTSASGSASMAMGVSVISGSQGELAVGTYNTTYLPTGVNSFSTNDRAFGVGIGTGGGGARKDGLIVYKSGNTFISNVGFTPASGTESIITGYGAGALQVRASGDGFNMVTGTGSNSVNIAKFSTPSAGNRYISFGHLGGTYLGNFTEIGRIEASGGSGVSYMTSSDARLKIDNGSFSHGLSTIKSINIHNYTWKEDQRKDVGVFAQELYKVFPIAVSKGDDNASLDKNQKIWQVDYSKLVPVLIAATQELSKKIEELEAKNAQLTSQVKEMASLKSDIEIIKAQLGLDIKTTVANK